MPGSDEIFIKTQTDVNMAVSDMDMQEYLEFVQFKKMKAQAMSDIESKDKSVNSSDEKKKNKTVILLLLLLL